LLQQAAQNQPGDSTVLFDFAQAAYAMGKVMQRRTAMQNALQSNLSASQAAEARRMLDMITLVNDPAQAAGATARVAEILKAEPDYAPALMVQAKIKEQAGDAATAGCGLRKNSGPLSGFCPGTKRTRHPLFMDSTKVKSAYALAMKARDDSRTTFRSQKPPALSYSSRAIFQTGGQSSEECASKSGNGPGIFIISVRPVQTQGSRDQQGELAAGACLKLAGSRPTPRADAW